MREALKTRISKYGPKTNASMTIENVQGKGLQLVVVYAGKKHYLPLSSVPLNPDTHANHPNHQKIKVNHDGNVGIGASLDARLDVDSATNEDGIISEMTHSSYTNSAIYGNVTQSSSGSSNILRLRSASTDRMVVLDNGDVGIGTNAPTAALHIDQESSSGAVPVLKLDQADIDDTFIDFIGTSAADGSRSISSDTTTDSAKFGAIAIEINGATKWIRIYDDHS